MDDTSYSVDRMGNANGALDFNGTSDYIITEAFALPITFTVCAWVKPDISSVKEILIHGTSSTGAFELYQNGTSVNLRGGSSSLSISQSGLIIGSWNFVCGVVNGTSGTVYVNETSSSGTIVTPNTSSEQLGIGSFVTGNYYFDGSISDVRVYDRSLTEEEIESLYGKSM